MASRAPIYALILLLVTMGLVFVAVGDRGVSTGVFLPGQPTGTPAPTAGPSPTPLPEPGADHWQESVPGQLRYTARPDSAAVIIHDTTTLDAFTQGLGIEPPPAGAPYPLLSALETMRDGFEEQIAALGLSAGPEALDGPATELVNGVPFSRLRVQLAAQPDAAGGQFPGLDLVIGLVQRPGDEIEVVQYRLQETPDPVIYADFRAWLDANITALSGAATAAGGDTAPESAEGFTGEGAPDTAGQEPSATEAAPAAGEGADEATGAASGPWAEIAEGILTYTADPATVAQIAYRSMPVEEFVAGSGFEAPAQDASTPMLDLLTQLRGTLTGQLVTQGVVLGEDTFTGPEPTEIAGKPAARLRLQAPPATLTSGQAFPGLDMEIILVALDAQQVTAIQYTYQGDPAESVYPAFQAWLDENAARVTVPAPAPEPEVIVTPAPAVTATPGGG